jgi:hypothetical protein
MKEAPFMYGELEQVARSLPIGCEVVTGKRAEVVALLRRGERRGELVLLSRGVVPLGTSGEVYAPIRRLKAPVPTWRRPALLAGGTLAAVAVMLWTLWMVASVLTTLAGGLAVAGLALAGVVLARRGRGGEVLEVVQRVTVRR